MTRNSSEGILNNGAKVQEAARLAGLLSSEIRLRILELVFQGKSVAKIIERLGITRQAAQRHFHELDVGAYIRAMPDVRPIFFQLTEKGTLARQAAEDLYKLAERMKQPPDSVNRWVGMVEEHDAGSPPQASREGDSAA